jgi:hypothetical protein
MPKRAKDVQHLEAEAVVAFADSPDSGPKQDGLERRKPQRELKGFLSNAVERERRGGDVSVRNALAQVYSIYSEKDIEARLADVSRYSDSISRRAYLFFYFTHKLVVLLYWGLTAIVSAMAVELVRYDGISTWNGLWLFSIIALLLIFGVFFTRQVRAYGFGIPKAPTESQSSAELDGALKEAISALLQELRKESGIRLYYYWWGFAKLKPKPADRRVFFGRYCNLLFSEHFQFRRLVPRYGAPFLCSSDIFVRRADLDDVLARLKSEYKSGPGRYPNGLRDAALLDLSSELLSDSNLLKVPEEVAIPRIVRKLSSWYSSHPTQNANPPEPADMKKQAGGIHRGLKHLSCYRTEKGES